MIAYDKSKLKIIGVCYGHQLLAHHFGSQIVNKDIVGRLQHIKFSKDLIDENKFL